MDRPEPSPYQSYTAKNAQGEEVLKHAQPRLEPYGRLQRPGREPGRTVIARGDDGGLRDADEPTRRRVKTGPLLACPYYKLDSIKHYECLTRQTLDSTGHVAQHLRRCHFQCPACGSRYGTSRECSDHVRQQSCSLHNPRQTSVDQRWYSIWDVVLPGNDRPDSPYVNSGIEENAGILRRLLQHNHSVDAAVNFVITHLATHNVPVPHTNIVRGMVTGIQNLVLDNTHIRSLIAGAGPGDSPNSPRRTHTPATQKAQLTPHPISGIPPTSKSSTYSYPPAPQPPALSDTILPFEVPLAPFPEMNAFSESSFDLPYFSQAPFLSNTGSYLPMDFNSLGGATPDKADSDNPHTYHLM